jgi:ribonuclease BN (tRNA processing enzyme)
VSGLRVRILGCRAGAPDPGSACSGYLVEWQSGHLLVDCGPGVLTELLRAGLADRLDGVVLTHRHADHTLDLVALAYRRRLATPPAPRLPLWLPEESLDYADELDDLFAMPSLDALRRPIGQAFDVRGLRRDGRTTVEPLPGLTVVAHPALHAAPSAALRFRAGPRVVAFSSDTAWAPGVVAAAEGADLFLCEATYVDQEPAVLERHGHLLAAQAGELAATAEARGLVLTHLSDWAAAEATLARARAGARGVAWVALARPGAVFAAGAG